MKTATARKHDQAAEEKSPAFKEALALAKQGRYAEAAEGFFASIVRDDAEDAGSWTNLGTSLRRVGHCEAALAASARALELDPGRPSTRTNHGNCLADLDRRDEALAAHAKAAALKPDDFLIRSNYAIALREFCFFEESVVHFDAALKLRPDDVKMQWERAMALLHLERFKEGWDAYEVRWKQPGVTPRVFAAPRWRGEDLRGKTLLIHEEQGFGDTILCSRYIPLVKARGARVILECRQPLHRLLSAVPGLDRIVTPGETEKEPFDFYIPMMSLPGIFQTDLGNIPPPVPLHVPASVPAATLPLLDAGKGRLKVGVVWSGSTTFVRNRRRAVAVERFLPLAAIPGVQLYSLQKGPCEPELAACGGTGIIWELGPHLNDFADTAAVLKRLDLVIMTDSAVAHVAGSLGVPVWNLLCYMPYWLYLSKRRDSPWYPSMRLFRQEEPGDWDGVFRRVARALQEAAGR